MRVSRLACLLALLVAATCTAHLLLWFTHQEVPAGLNRVEQSHKGPDVAFKQPVGALVLAEDVDDLVGQLVDRPDRSHLTMSAPSSFIEEPSFATSSPLQEDSLSSRTSFGSLAEHGGSRPATSLQAPLLLLDSFEKKLLIHSSTLERATKQLAEESSSWLSVRSPRFLECPSWLQHSRSLPYPTKKLLYWVAPALSHLRVATSLQAGMPWQVCTHCKAADFASILSYEAVSIESFDIYVDEDEEVIVLLASLRWNGCEWPSLSVATSQDGLEFTLRGTSELYCDPSLPHSVSILPVGETLVLLARQGPLETFRAGRIQGTLATSPGQWQVEWGADLWCPSCTSVSPSLWCEEEQVCYVLHGDEGGSRLYASMFVVDGLPFTDWFTQATRIAHFEVVRSFEWYERLDTRADPSVQQELLLSWPSFSTTSSGSDLLVTYTAAGGHAIVQASLVRFMTDIHSLRDCSYESVACTQEELLLLVSSPDCMMERRSRLRLSHDCSVGFELEPQCEGREAPVLITGTGRSGTSFLANLLSQLGFSVAHDSTQSCPESSCTQMDAAVSWVHLFAETAQCHVPSWSYQADCFETVVQLVREPLASIQSRAWGRPLTVEIQQWMACFLDLRRTGMRGAIFDTLDFPLFALRSWVLWNAFANNVSVDVFQLEDLVQSFPEVIRLITVAFGADKAAAVSHEQWEEVNRGGAVNQHERALNDPLTWLDFFEMDPMFTSMAVQQAALFGYHYASDGRESVELGTAGSDTILEVHSDHVRLVLGDSTSCWTAFHPLSSCSFVPPQGLWACSIESISCS